MFNETLFKDSIASRTKTMETMFARTLISSHVSGLDFRADSATTFEVDEGVIFVSDPENQNFKFQRVEKQTGIAISGTVLTRIDVLPTGIVTVIANPEFMTEQEKIEGNVQIGIIAALDLINIDEEFTVISALFGMSIPGNQDLFASGIRTINGLGLNLNADLTFGSDTGLYVDPSAVERFNCPDQPYQVTPPSINQYGTDRPMFREWFGNTGPSNFKLSAFISAVDPSVYDDPDLAPSDNAPSGALSGLESQNISVHIGNSKTGLVCGLQYGRVKYAKLADAVIDAAKQVRENAVNLRGTRFAGIISIWQGASDMSLPTHAVFTPPNTIMTGTF